MKLIYNYFSDDDDGFINFRIHYLIVHVAIMLADGLQGTHLYVLYESYGYSVASLYALGFFTGALTSPLIGPVVDYIGRRKSAMIYCVLEMFINMLELFDNLPGLILSRMIGGITTNLLYSVFESWLITEHKKRRFSDDKLEVVLRDSVIASNLSAVVSGMLAHVLAIYFGNAGPFQGAVFSTGVALCLVTRWEENYGGKERRPEVSILSHEDEASEEVSIINYMVEAFKITVSSKSIRRIGLIQGLTDGALQTFVFLWSPALSHFATLNPESCAQSLWGISNVVTDDDGNETLQCEPAYGLIFGAYMTAGVIGGLFEPIARKYASKILGKNEQIMMNNTSMEDNKSVQSNLVPCKYVILQRVPSTSPTEVSIYDDSTNFQISSDQEDFIDPFLNKVKIGKLSLSTVETDFDIKSLDDNHTQNEEYSISSSESKSMPVLRLDTENKVAETEYPPDENGHPPGIEKFVACIFFMCSFLLAIPMIAKDSSSAYSICLTGFLIYEFMVGLYLPLDGLIRSVYIPTESICSIHTMLRVLVNIAVAIGVMSTNYIEFTSAFAGCSIAMVLAGGLMLSLREVPTGLSFEIQNSSLKVKRE